jgi:cell division transport system ATP-binding protein
MELINFKSVVIEREEQMLFSGIDFQISSGEFVYLIGKVGSGKSSLLQTIYAELPIAAGQAEVLDFDLCHLKRSRIPHLRRKLGIIFQDFQLLTDRTVEENLRFVLKATGWNSREEMDERIRTVLTQVGMENKGYRMPNTLSGGEQQRVVIARALLNAPDIILADEPTGNLDPETGNNIVQLLYDICRDNHTAVIMSTHNLTLPERYPGRVLQVQDQKLVDVSKQFQADNAPVIVPPAVGTTVPAPQEPDAEASVTSEEPAVEEPATPQETDSEPILPLPTEAAPSTSECGPETQTPSAPDSADSNNDAAHCSPEDDSHATPHCSEQSGQTPSESAQL